MTLDVCYTHFDLFDCFQINFEPGIQYNIQNNGGLCDNFGVTCQRINGTTFQIV